MLNNKNHITPPRLAERLLSGFLKPELSEEVLGDLDEKFYSALQKHSVTKAKLNYWYQVFNYMRPFALKSTKFENPIISPMKVYFKFTIRVFHKNALITLASLASVILGVLSSFLIYLWVDAELNTDRFHTNYAKLYIPVVQQSPVDKLDPVNTSLYFNANYAQYPEIDQSLQAYYFRPDRIKLVYDNNEYRGGGLVTDSTFFDLFDFRLVEGNPQNILSSPTNIVLTQSFAQRIFGDLNPIGETMQLDQTGIYKVAGILENIPSNSSMHFDFLVPSHSSESWDISGMEFLLANDSFDQAEFNEKIKELGRKHPQFKESIVSVVPFSDVYFDLHLDEDLLANHGDISDVKTMTLVAIVILLISALNFTNMQSTLLHSQVKTRGIKQVHGARSFDFFLELIASRLIYAFISIVLITGLFFLVKPSYLAFQELTVNKSWAEILLLVALGCFVFLLITTLISLLQSSRVATSKALLAKVNSNRGANTGKVLTTIQYVFAIVLIIASGVIFKQFKYMQNKDLGYNPENLVSVKFFDRVPYTGDFEEFKKQSLALKKSYDHVRGELEKIPGIESYSQGELPLSGNVSGMSWKLANSDFEYSDIKLLAADPSFAETLGLSMLKGRFFSDSLDVERQSKVVINKAAMDFWGIDDLAGVKVASSAWRGEKKPWQVIGVVDNFNFEHLSRKVEPLIIVFFEDFEREFTFRISEERFKQTIEAVSDVFQQVYPSRTFTYTVLESQLNAQYAYEKKLSQTFLLFTLVALILSSIGLFTFALYDTHKRIKEIGIRKVVGASTEQLVSMLSSHFLKWVLLAFIIAIPIAWYAMNEWLANFAHQTQLSWWIFTGAGILAAFLALATVIGQSFTVANRNPVHALRHE